MSNWGGTTRDDPAESCRYKPRPRRSAAGVALVAAVLAGCSAGDEDATPAGSTQQERSSSSTTSATLPPVSSTTTPSTTATTVAAGVPELPTFSMGDLAEYDDGSSVRVHGVTQPFEDAASLIGAPTGQELVSVDVEVCAGSRPDDDFAFDAFDAYPETGPRFQSRISSQTPAFFGAPLVTGQCNRGYVEFVADSGVPATWVVWRAPGWEAIRFRVT